MVNNLTDILKEYNLRITSQRKAILQVLYDCRGHHLEIEHIYRRLTKNGNTTQKIGLATVYRTMELFEKIGLVSRLTMDNLPSQYELNIDENSSHHHLICLNCGQVQEIDDVLTEDLKGRILKDKEFQVDDKSMKIYGYCSKCRNHNKK